MTQPDVIKVGQLEIRYFRDVAKVVSAGGPPDRAQLLAVLARYGLAPAPQRA